jgi:hypothetical protein
MATILGPIGRVVHDAAAGLIENQIPKKVADSVNGLVNSGSGIVTDVLGIIRDITRPDDAPTPPAPGGGGRG